MRLNPWSAGLFALAFASAGVGLVTAQEAPPPITVPPEESTADPAPPIDPNAPSTPPDGEAETPPAGIADPAPYKVLGPDSRRAQAEEPPPPPPPPPPPETLEPEVEEEIVPVDPGPPPPLPRRPRHTGAIIQTVDKVTAETLRFEVDARRPVRWKSLVFRVSGCETEAANEPLKESTAHLTVTSEPRAQPGRTAPEPAQVFRGWMFASSPGLNPFEHPVYDAWLVGCRVPLPVTPAVGTETPTGPSAGRPAPERSAPLGPRPAEIAAAVRPPRG